MCSLKVGPLADTVAGVRDMMKRELSMTVLPPGWVEWVTSRKWFRCLS